MGVIGAGAWGKNHVRTAATLPEAELVAVCDADPKTRERIGRQYPAVHVTADVADLLSRVDAVVIASPATTHARVALQCVEAGKPCLVEKPFALSTRDAEAVARAAAERKVPVLAGHLLVFHPAVERLRALVQGGELGRVYYLYGLRVNLGQVRADENALRSYDKRVERQPESGSYGEALSSREGDTFIPKIPNVEPLAAEVGHFTRVARGMEPPRASAEDGVRVVRVLEAATRSLATGGAPVEL